MAGAGISGYGEVLRHRAAALPMAASLVARLPFALAPLSMVLLIADVRGSYGDAGLVTGAYGLGTAAGAPALGRALDRFGQPRVIGPAGVACALLLMAIAVLAAGDAWLPWIVATAFAAGTVFPPLGPAMRAAFREVFPDETRRRAGYALDTVAVEIIFIAGPLLLSQIVTRTPRVFPLVLTGFLLAAGALTYSRCSAPRRVRPHRARGERLSGGTPLRTPAMAAVFLVILVFAIAFGSIDTSIAATSREVLDNPTTLGYLFSAIAGGSAVGGLVYGAKASHAPTTEQRRLPVPLLMISLALTPLALLLRTDDPPVLLLLPFLFLAGLSIAPILIMAQNLTDAVCAPAQVNEAQAWLNTAVTTGAALGTAVAGVVIDGIGVPGSFGVAAAATASASIGAVAAQSAWRRGIAAYGSVADRAATPTH